MPLKFIKTSAKNIFLFFTKVSQLNTNVSKKLLLSANVNTSVVPDNVDKCNMKLALDGFGPA